MYYKTDNGVKTPLAQPVIIPGDYTVQPEPYLGDSGRTVTPDPVVMHGRKVYTTDPALLAQVGYVWEDDPPPTIPEIDCTEFDAACAQFRSVCAAIGEVLGVDNFRGGFEEIAAFQQSEAAQTTDGILLALRWSAADKLCTYTASKLGIGQPQWWYKCWEEVADV